MAKNTSVTLSDHFQTFIAEKVASGRFGNASEVVRAGLRLLEREENKLEALRLAIDAGDSSPEAEDLDGKEVLTRLRKKHGLGSRRA